MRCEQVQELFSPYLDKMTSQKETELVEAHLQECAKCKQFLAELSAMCTLLKNMETPQVPERFAMDLHKRLADEKIKIFSAREIITPKKSGWLAASVAGIALTIGIFTSSIMPMDSMVATLQNWVNGDNDKPPAAVIDNDKLLKDWADKNNSGRIAANFGIETGSKTEAVNNPNEKPDQEKPETNANISTPSHPITVALKERVVDNWSAKINVDNMDSTVKAVQQIADASGAQFSESNPKHTVVASAASTVKVVSLQVPKEKVDQVINQLAGLGAVPSKDSNDFTTAYAEAEKALNAVDQDIKKLESLPCLSTEQQQQLKKLEETQTDLLAEKQRIDKEYNLVKIEVRLVEGINP